MLVAQCFADALFNWLHAGVVLPLLCRKLGSCWWRCRLPGMWRRRGTSSSSWVSDSACLHAPQRWV